MNNIMLNEILKKHKMWLNNEESGERADLRGADLRGAKLGCADLRGAKLSDADLSGADLRDADLRGADLRGTKLGCADLKGADLRGADLSGAENLLSSVDYLRNNFECTAEGIIAYKVFNAVFSPPTKWKIQPKSVITENVNANRTNDCGCGINVATLEWVLREYSEEEIWKVLIRWEWLCGVVVPYNTDGKIRCERVELVEMINKKES